MEVAEASTTVETLKGTSKSVPETRIIYRIP